MPIFRAGLFDKRHQPLPLKAVRQHKAFSTPSLVRNLTIPTIGLCGLMPTNPQGKPCIMFLFVWSLFCLLLPSDFASRQTPLHLADDSHWMARSGL